MIGSKTRFVEQIQCTLTKRREESFLSFRLVARGKEFAIEERICGFVDWQAAGMWNWEDVGQQGSMVKWNISEEPWPNVLRGVADTTEHTLPATGGALTGRRKCLPSGSLSRNSSRRSCSLGGQLKPGGEFCRRYFIDKNCLYRLALITSSPRYNTPWSNDTGPSLDNTFTGVRLISS